MFETDDHQRLRQHARDFAHAEIHPHAARMDTSPGEVDNELVQTMARLGWVTAAVPTAWGGLGLGHLAKTIMLEEISRVSPAMGAALQASQLGAAMFLHYGNEDLLEEWMPRFTEGACLPTIAVTEDESGGHVLGMQATARRDGDHWILNGRKMYVGNSHVADVFGVVVRTGPDSDHSSRSLSAFLVERKRPGVRLVPYQPARGLHGFSFGDVILQDVKVPAANIIGSEGDGTHVAYAASILAGRPNLAAVAVGIHQALLDDTVDFAQTRRRYGKPLAHHPVIRQRIGQIKSRLMSARAAAYQAVHRLDHGRPCDEDLIHAKLQAAQTVRESAEDAMDTHGAAGLRTDRRVGQLAQDARCVEPPAGTSDIQLLRLGEAATGIDHGQYSVRLADRVALHPPPLSPPADTEHEHVA